MLTTILRHVTASQSYAGTSADHQCSLVTNIIYGSLQIVMSANKEAVISEKELSCRFGQEVLVGYAEPIRSSEYDSFDAFVDAVQREWDVQWKRIYSAEFSSMQISLKNTCTIKAGIATCAEDSDRFQPLWYLMPMSLIPYTDC